MKFESLGKIISSWQGQLQSKKKRTLAKSGGGNKGRTLSETLQKTILMINMQKVRGGGVGRGQVHTGTAESSVLNLHDCFGPLFNFVKVRLHPAFSVLRNGTHTVI